MDMSKDTEAIVQALEKLTEQIRLQSFIIATADKGSIAFNFATANLIQDDEALAKLTQSLPGVR